MKTLKDYLNKGVHQNKIIEIKQPSATWSLTRKIVVDHTNYLEVVKDSGGNLKPSIENNRRVNVLSYTELDQEMIDKINNSEGILAYTENLYNEYVDINGVTIRDTTDHFRFAFIPEDEINIPDYEDRNN